MELTELSLASENWAATPAGAQALILAQRERIRELEAQLGQASSNSSRHGKGTERFLRFHGRARGLALSARRRARSQWMWAPAGGQERKPCGTRFSQSSMMLTQSGLRHWMRSWRRSRLAGARTTSFPSPRSTGYTSRA